MGSLHGILGCWDLVDMGPMGSIWGHGVLGSGGVGSGSPDLGVRSGGVGTGDPPLILYPARAW